MKPVPLPLFCLVEAKGSMILKLEERMMMGWLDANWLDTEQHWMKHSMHNILAPSFHWHTFPLALSGAIEDRKYHSTLWRLTDVVDYSHRV